MPPIPRVKNIESTLSFISDPYGFVTKQCRIAGTDVFEARLMLRWTLFMSGPEAAKIFYDPELLTRRDAAPGRIAKTLFGQGGVQSLDGEKHIRRKDMFMSVLTDEHARHVCDEFAQAWEAQLPRWRQADHIVLYREMHEVLTRAACAWAGVPLPEEDVAQRTRELTAMFDHAGDIGPAHWWARLARKRGERWAAGIIEDVRSGRLQPAPDSPLATIAAHHDDQGQPLDPRIAAVEVLNLLRPTVAVSVYIAFAAHALHKHPEWRERVADPNDAELFAQEIRRFYPFFPSVIARVRRDFEWQDYHFPHGRLVVFDLHGTNHDPRTWDDPDRFQPERFQTWNRCPYNFVPQGGGSHHTHHRCPGERLTIELIKTALRQLTTRIAYDLPEQDLEIDRGRLPALPKSGIVLTNIRPTPDAPPPPAAASHRTSPGRTDHARSASNR